MPAGFRLTCYYYRGAYYKSFWADPPACTVGEPRKRYWGENSLPLILQNVHRYFLVLAVIVVFVLAHDAWKALWFSPVDLGSVTLVDPAAGSPISAGGSHAARFGLGIGSLVLLANAVLLAGYTFGCHSLRHLIGGGRDEISRIRIQLKTYDCVSCLNRRHMTWAWLSLFWVAFTDLYVRMCSMGIWTDWRLF